MFKVNKWNTRKRCGICSKLTIKTPQQRHRRQSSVCIVSFEDILTRLVWSFLLGWANMILDKLLIILYNFLWSISIYSCISEEWSKVTYIYVICPSSLGFALQTRLRYTVYAWKRNLQDGKRIYKLAWKSMLFLIHPIILYLLFPWPMRMK